MRTKAAGEAGRRWSHIALALALVVAPTGSAAAIELAGGGSASLSAEPGAQRLGPAVGSDASVDEEAAGRQRVSSGDPEHGLPRLALGAFLLCIGLGGGALLLRKRPALTRPFGKAPQLSVVAATRLGPKAHLALVEVGGRGLLVGVTEHSVSRLGWLAPGELSGAAREARRTRSNLAAPWSPEEEAPSPTPQAIAEPVSGRAAKATPGPPQGWADQRLARFQELLRGATERSPSAPPPPPAPAALHLAAQTTDVVSTSGRARAPASTIRRSEPSRATAPTAASSPTPGATTQRPRAPQAVEGQVAGLRGGRGSVPPNGGGR